VLSASGEWLAKAAFSPASQIRARIWSWTAEEAVDASFIRRRLQSSLAARAALAASGEVTAYREVYAESDGLPGLIVDRYARYRVVQFLSAGAERYRDQVVECLAGLGDCNGIVERSDVDVRGLEGLAERRGLLWGEDPAGPVLIQEYELRFLADLHQGHKTGFYLDQRENRRRARRYLGQGEVLNCFAYTAAFTAIALHAGAERVTSVDSSAGALDLGRENVRLNHLPDAGCEWVEGNAFEELRRFRDQGRSFDAIVLDPPRFAATTSHVGRASRGYKDINWLAFRLLRPGGSLVTFSCSGGVGPELFQKIVADAALDASVQAVVVEWMGQPADHPVALNFPEGRYLKGLVCQVR